MLPKLDAVGADLQVKDLCMDGCNSLFTVFSDSKNTTFDSVQLSNYHCAEMIVQRPRGDLVIKGMIANAISGVLYPLFMSKNLGLGTATRARWSWCRGKE